LECDPVSGVAALEALPLRGPIHDATRLVHASALPYTPGLLGISEGDCMQAVLKGLHSTDIADVATYVPDEEDNFGFVLRAMIGPMNSEGEESFDIMVCTPRWLLDKYGTSDVLLGLHKLIVFKYDYLRLRQFIEKYLMRCSGDTWQEIAQKVSLLGQWEFEG
jgi:hypothetical protein